MADEGKKGKGVGQRRCRGLNSSGTTSQGADPPHQSEESRLEIKKAVDVRGEAGESVGRIEINQPGGGGVTVITWGSNRHLEK